MITPIEFKGFNFTKEPNYASLEQKLLNVQGWEIHDLGMSADTINHVHGFSLGDLEKKPVIYIQGGIHGGHEWRCPHWLMRFMEILATPKGYPQKKWIDELKREFSFYVIPCLSPYGYENNSYVNANGVNLNRNFDVNWSRYPTYEPFHAQYKGSAPFSEPETQIVKSIVELYKPLVFVDNHTWGGFTGCALEIEHPAKPYAVLLESIVNSLKLLNKDSVHTTYSNSTTTQRSADWAARKVSKRGYKCISMAFEPGSLESEYEQSRIGINAMFLICLYVYKWSKERKMTF